MEEDIRLVILEHLGDKLNVHVLAVDVLAHVSEVAPSHQGDVANGT